MKPAPASVGKSGVAVGGPSSGGGWVSIPSGSAAVCCCGVRDGAVSAGDGGPATGLTRLSTLRSSVVWTKSMSRKSFS